MGTRERRKGLGALPAHCIIRRQFRAADDHKEESDRAPVGTGGRGHGRAENRIKSSFLPRARFHDSRRYYSE
ncbi:hypothetical protein EVAR_5535_1 [Eumeta japonica]|uniref:Uncharacterized protein n=1 Tax=Eumeta variegata TaxID=151549 RepID=A0A4C1T8Z3_EUMVA|nr:hypothetical protein EVAR_5535_1 [Eumeta japonica]